MSLLNQLKQQASALQMQQESQQLNLDANTRQTELACQTTALYLADLAKQLNVIQPTGPELSLDGKARWPAMRLVDFRSDARKKKLRDKEVYDYIALGWQIEPQPGGPATGVVSVNFLPELERVQKRLSYGGVKFERKDIRYPDSNKLQAVQFDHEIRARGYITVTALHDESQLQFRLANLTGFDIQNVTWDAARIQTETLDELAKLLLGQSSRFL